MKAARHVVRWVVIGAFELAETRFGKLPGVRTVMSGLGNRVVPALTRAVYRPGPVEVNGITMSVPEPSAWGGGGEFHMVVGSYERREIQCLLARLQPGDCFLDVGAHVGYFTLPAARRVGKTGRVVAFEPTPASAKLLRTNVHLNDFGWVDTVEAAASSTVGVASFTTSGQSAMWNTLETDTLSGETSSEPVATTTLDHEMERLDWPPVSCIKMDVEGHEAAVLDGAERTLTKNPGVHIMFEVSGGDDVRRQASLRTMEKFESLGFGFRAFNHRGVTEPIALAGVIERLNAERWQQSLLNLIAVRPDESSLQRTP